MWRVFFFNTNAVASFRVSKLAKKSRNDLRLVSLTIFWDTFYSQNLWNLMSRNIFKLTASFVDFRFHLKPEIYAGKQVFALVLNREETFSMIRVIFWVAVFFCTIRSPTVNLTFRKACSQYGIDSHNTPKKCYIISLIDF